MSTSSRVQQVVDHVDPPSVTKMSVETWESVPLAPPDSIFNLTTAYKADTFPQKVNLGVGAYRDDNSKPWVLPVVKKATEILFNDPNLDHEYLPIVGLSDFITAAARIVLGDDSPALAEKRVATVQTMSGTGANHTGALFLSKFYNFNGPQQVYLSNPTWANHYNVFRNVGFEPLHYKYYDPKTVGLAFDEFLGSLNSAPDRSIFVLHACAHNPTGIDPTREQWSQIADVMLQKGHYAFFDCAYQGFASGDLDGDAWAVREFVKRNIPMLICQSFAKNAGLYGERVGALHIITPSPEAANRVRSQLAIISRSEISNPAAHGAKLMALILNDPELFNLWLVDIKTMANRIIDMRKELYRLLTDEYKTPGSWKHIVDQIGMFSFTGLNAQQSQAMIDKAHIYLTSNGRISVAGLNSKNIKYVAENIDKVVRGQL